MRWRAFYADGQQVTSDQSTWADLPAENLVIAVWWDERGTRHLECGADALVYTDTAIVSVNLPTPTLLAAGEAERAAGRLKLGVYMAPDDWAAIRALADQLEL